jgi:hypothetical protein
LLNQVLQVCPASATFICANQAQAGQQAMQQGQQPTIADQVMGQGQASVSGIGAHEIPGMMEEQNYADGGIVAFAPGGSTSAPAFDYRNSSEVPPEIMRAVHGAESLTSNPQFMRSKAGAIGPFQFMPATGKEYGLGSEEDLMDFAKSKEASAKYLKKLYAMYGNWEEALRAYNAGPQGYNDIKAGKKKSSENENYFSRVLQYVPVSERERLGMRKDFNVPPGPVSKPTSQEAAAPQGIASVISGMQNSAAPAGPDFASRARELDGIRQTRLAEVEKAYKEEIAALGPAPKASNLEAIRKKALDEAAAINAPYLEEMRALTQSSEPSEKSARDKVFLALMLGRGQGLSGAIGDIAAAGSIGLDAYTAAQSKHEEAQRLMLKSKFELAKGDKQYADQLADAAVREDRNASSLHKAGLQAAQQGRRSNQMAVDQSMDARFAIEKSIEESRLREMGLDRREAARIATENTRYQRSEDANKRAVLGQLHRSIDQFTRSKEMEPYIKAERSTAEYKMKSKAGDRAGAEAEAMQRAKNKVIQETLAAHGFSLEEYTAYARGIGGLPVQPGVSAAPAASSVPSKGFVLDRAGNFKEY